MQPSVNTEHSVEAIGRDVDTLDLVGRGKGDRFAIDLQRAGHMSRKKDQSRLPRVCFLCPCPCHVAHQHMVALLQGDQRVIDVNVDLAEVEGGGLTFPLPILATDLEERQVHGRMAYFHQGVSTGALDGMTPAIKAHIVGTV